MPAGRPTIYTKELADNICKELALGRSLRSVCKEEKMPDMSTIFEWIRKYPEFSKHYAIAKEESADADLELLKELGDEAIELSQSVDPKASGAVVQAVKLKADNLKWSMSKMKPKKYGDKLDMTTNGKDLPTPILNGVPSNNSDKKDSILAEEN